MPVVSRCRCVSKSAQPRDLSEKKREKTTNASSNTIATPWLQRILFLVVSETCCRFGGEPPPPAPAGSNKRVILQRANGATADSSYFAPRGRPLRRRWRCLARARATFTALSCLFKFRKEKNTAIIQRADCYPSKLIALRCCALRRCARLFYKHSQPSSAPITIKRGLY